MKWVTTTGIAVGVSRFALAEMPDFRARETLPGPGSAPPLPGRIDGIAKVTGAKLYASDFRAADLPAGPGAPRMRCWSVRQMRLMSIKGSIWLC